MKNHSTVSLFKLSAYQRLKDGEGDLTKPLNMCEVSSHEGNTTVGRMSGLIRKAMDRRQWYIHSVVGFCPVDAELAADVEEVGLLLRFAAVDPVGVASCVRVDPVSELEAFMKLMVW